MQTLWWFATVCTPGADKVVGLQTEVEDFGGGGRGSEVSG
jgi:hypothetical protein